jgi:hypothetical protein
VPEKIPPQLSDKEIEIVNEYVMDEAYLPQCKPQYIY